MRGSWAAHSQSEKMIFFFSSTLQMESCWRQTISAPDPASLGVWGPESCLLPGPRRQTVWAQLWWSRRRTWRCWFPGRLLAYRERWESRKLWFWERTKTEERVKTQRLKAAQKDLTTKEKPHIEGGMKEYMRGKKKDRKQWHYITSGNSAIQLRNQPVFAGWSAPSSSAPQTHQQLHTAYLLSEG